MIYRRAHNFPKLLFSIRDSFFQNNINYPIFRLTSTLSKSKNFNNDEIFQILNLKEFNETELKLSHESLRAASTECNVNKADGIKINLLTGIEKLVIKNTDLDVKYAKNSGKIINLFNRLSHQNFEEYNSKVMTIAEEVDSRLWPIAFSFLCAGLSIGIIVPCMPILIKVLEIPSSQYGFIVGAFGLSKLLGNIPSGYFVDKYGRKPVMIAGILLCSLGIGGVGMSLLPGLGTPWLFSCRLMTGLGVSAFTAGAFMYLSDISTKLNRVRTQSPAMASFQGGTALGPALGGILIDNCGITKTYCIVGGLFIALASYNYFGLEETLRKKATETINIHHKSITSIISETFRSWNKLLENPKINDILMINCAYWFAFAGTQMTLLPIHMVSPIFNLTAINIGACFALMSLVSVGCSYPISIVADKFGKLSVIVVGCSVLSCAIAILPFASSFYQLLMVLVPFAFGSTCISSIPQPYISDITSNAERSQAMSLLRTGGDIGLLTGALFSGLFSELTSVTTTMEINSAIIFIAMVAFCIRIRS